MQLGIIDVGTNSIHLLVGILGLNGRFHVSLKERDLTRLGEGGLASGQLTKASMRRAIEVLGRYTTILKRCGVDEVQAVATSAVREASNGMDFVAEVRKTLGLPLRVISGEEEAKLIYLGVVQAHGLKVSSVVITIGGGSAQVIRGDGAHLRYVTSVQLGGARLSQLFIHHDPPLPGELQAIKAHVKGVWAPVGRALRNQGWNQALASSATIAQLMLAAKRSDKPRKRKDFGKLTVKRKALADFVESLARSTARERRQLPGLDPRREDLALPTGITLLEWMEACGVDELRYAPGSLREGLVMDYLIRHQRGQTQRIEHPLEALWSPNGEAALWVKPPSGCAGANGKKATPKTGVKPPRIEE